MLIKIAILTIIVLSAFALAWFRGPDVWRVIRTSWLEMKLTGIDIDREHVLRLQHILELPNAYELLLIEGIMAHEGGSRLSFIAAPSPREVKNFIEVNRTITSENASQYRHFQQLTYLLETLQEREDHIQAALFVIAARDKPAHRELYLTDQRAKIKKLEHQLATARQQLERLKVEDSSPDPYGRLPKMRLERFVPATNEVAPKKANSPKKKRR